MSILGEMTVKLEQSIQICIVKVCNVLQKEIHNSKIQLAHSAIK